jgi:hypothetical protein
VPSWPWTFSTLPAGNVAASKLDDNFNAAMFAAGSSINGAVPTWTGTAGNAFSSGGIPIGTAANNIVALNGNSAIPSAVFQPTTTALAADVALASAGTYYDGPSIALSSSNLWIAGGTVTLQDPAGAEAFAVILWDGTTVIASTNTQTRTANACVSVTLFGYMPNPAGNVRLSVNSLNSSTAFIRYNASGQSKDSTITAFRIG